MLRFTLLILNGDAGPGPYIPTGQTDAKDVKVPPPQGSPPFEAYPVAGPLPPTMGPTMPATTVYNYVNPATHEVVSSLLPPDHPQMVCLQQGHVPHTRYGVLGKSYCSCFLLRNANDMSAGVLAAVFWFPLGIGLCLLDRRVQCRRCGMIVDDGISC